MFRRSNSMNEWTRFISVTVDINNCPSLWPSGIGSRLGRNRSWVRLLAVSDIYPMFIEPTITWVPSGFSGYIWLDTKIVLKNYLGVLSKLIYKHGTMQEMYEWKNVCSNRMGILSKLQPFHYGKHSQTCSHFADVIVWPGAFLEVPHGSHRCRNSTLAFGHTQRLICLLSIIPVTQIQHGQWRCMCMQLTDLMWLGWGEYPVATFSTS